MMHQELRERVAQKLFHQSTMEHDWDTRRDFVKDMYRKQADQIFNLIKDSGWELRPRAETAAETTAS